MHLYILTRGTLRAHRDWEEMMAGQFLPMEVKDAKGKKETAYFQLQLRPVRMYEVVFPEEHEDKVMGIMKPTTPEGFGGKWGKVGLWFAKRLGLKPAIKDWKPFLIPPNSGVSILALGTKKDVVNWTKEPSANSFLDSGNIPRECL